MHILLGVLAVIGVIALWIWRARAAAQASGDIVDAADDVRAAVRRFGYRRKAGRHPAESVEDPRLAAAGLMAACARMDGDITAEQQNALRVECRAKFRVDQKEADDIAAYGRWIASQSQDPDDTIRRLTPVVRDNAPAEAHADMVEMLRRVASVVDGAPSEIQSDAIERVRRALGVGAA